ncbi:unnamed protein product, partial [Polarella glacialis]
SASEARFIIVAVSGTLQDGFPLRKNLDYTDPCSGAVAEATFLGWALCRGVKAYFDVKDPSCREYVPAAEGAARVNPAMVATGCWEHANVYAVYLAHEKAALKALLHEPRYLSMSPDMAQMDLTAEETSDDLKKLFKAAISEHGKTESERVALLTVVSVFKGPSFVENPVLYTKADGTQVTNFHDGLAKLAGTSNAERGTAAYSEAVEACLRRLEAEHASTGAKMFVGKDALQMNASFTLEEFKALRTRAEAYAEKKRKV